MWDGIRKWSMLTNAANYLQALRDLCRAGLTYAARGAVEASLGNSCVRLQ